MTRTPRKKDQSAAQDRLDHIEEAQDVIDEAREHLEEMDQNKRWRDERTEEDR